MNAVSKDHYGSEVKHSLSRVWIRAMVCRVLPRPISSARMQPNPPESVIPITQEYMN